MKADIPQRCRGKLFSMYQVWSRYILMLLAAKLIKESAPKNHPSDLRVFSVWFFETIKTTRKMPQNIPFMVIQSGEPTGTVW